MGVVEAGCVTGLSFNRMNCWSPYNGILKGSRFHPSTSEGGGGVFLCGFSHKIVTQKKTQWGKFAHQDSSRIFDMLETKYKNMFQVHFRCVAFVFQARPMFQSVA